MHFNKTSASQDHIKASSNENIPNNSSHKQNSNVSNPSIAAQLLSQSNLNSATSLLQIPASKSSLNPSQHSPDHSNHLSPQSQKVQFILFLDPQTGQFFSFSPVEGYLIKERTPQVLQQCVQNQLQQLKIIIDNRKWQEISMYQRRPIATNLIIQSKFKYPLYVTHQQLPKAKLEEIKFDQNLKPMKQQIIDFIQAEIFMTHIQDQLQYTRKDHKVLQRITTNIKLIASVNEVILTLGRVILQDYSVVISTLSPKNKLIFKIRGKNEYLYGNDSLLNFHCIRAALARKQRIQLEIIQASIFDKEQYTRFFFTRQADDLRHGDCSEFPWQQFLYKNPPNELNLLMWYCPHYDFIQPKSNIDYDRLYSAQELTRRAEKVKIKLQSTRRKGLRKAPRYLWKINIIKFLQKRRQQIQNKIIEFEGSVIYSGQLCTKFQLKLVSLHNLFSLFKQKLPSASKQHQAQQITQTQPQQIPNNSNSSIPNHSNLSNPLSSLVPNQPNQPLINPVTSTNVPVPDRNHRRGFLRFLNKQLNQGPSNRDPSQFPNALQRFSNFSECKRQGMIEVIPFMSTISIEYVYGSQVLYKDETQPVIADSEIKINQLMAYSLVSNLMMELSIVFKIRVYSKEGDGLVCGVGVLKLFDEFGYMKQGKQIVKLCENVQGLQMNKMGCVGAGGVSGWAQDIGMRNRTSGGNGNFPGFGLGSSSYSIPTLTVELPTFRKPVIWTLKDKLCLKYLKYLPQANEGTSNNRRVTINNNNSLANSNIQDKNNHDELDRLDKILAYNPLQALQLTPEQKAILKRHYQTYKTMPDKLIFYLLSTDWTNPYEVAQVYKNLNQWETLPPIQALFLLNPRIPDQKVRYFAVERIEKMYQYELIFYSNQITQALVSFETDENPLIDLIIQKASYQPYTVGQEYLWQFRNRLTEPGTNHRFCMYLETLGMTTYIRQNFVAQIKIDQALQGKNANIIKLTERYQKFDDKKPVFRSVVPEIQAKLLKICPRGFFFPLHPQNIYRKILPEKCILFNSKKMLFSLSCLPSADSDIKPYRLIYKCGDDIKQDHLVLQMFNVFEQLWANAGFDFKMNIYKVLSTGNENGFIEMVDAVNSSQIHQDHGKDKISKAFDTRATLSFLEYHNKGMDLLVAKENFLKSSAGYFVATLVLGLGDRHSGNIMVQKNGRFFHIDFGHFLGNFKTKFGIKRETTPATFTLEYAQVMGGVGSANFTKFEGFCADAFNILRKNSNLIINLLAMMVSAEIPQLKKYQDINYMVNKLELGLSKTQAAEKISKIIKETLQSNSRDIDNAFHEWNRGG